MKIIKKTVLVLSILIVILIIIPQMQNRVEAAVKISATEKIMYKGYTYKLKVIGTKKKVKWSSSDKTKAVVYSNGKVYVKKNGRVTITAKVSGKKYKCKVTVKNKPYNLKQFSTIFYDIKDVAKKIKHIGDIKNYGEYKYDLDGDRKKDTIMVKKIVTNYEEGIEDYYYSITVNDKEIERVDSFSNIYILDLDKSDKTLELIVETEPYGDSAGYCYSIYQKKNNKMKKIADTTKLDYPAEPIKVNQKGKIVVRDYIENIFSPYIVGKYYELNDGNLIKIKTLLKNVSKLNFKMIKTYGGIGEPVYFTTNKNNIGKSNKSQEVKKGTKFTLLSMSFKPDTDGQGCRACKVRLSNRKVGYLYVFSSY